MTQIAKVLRLSQTPQLGAQECEELLALAGLSSGVSLAIGHLQKGGLESVDISLLARAITVGSLSVPIAKIFIEERRALLLAAMDQSSTEELARLKTVFRSWTDRFRAQSRSRGYDEISLGW